MSDTIATSRSQAPDWHRVEERLEQLERQHRRLKRAAAALLPLAGAIFVLGAARPNRTVEAQRFVLRGADGKVRATLEPAEQGSRLSFRYLHGKQAARLEVKHIGPDLTFFNEHGQMCARLDVSKGQPVLTLFDEKNQQRGVGLLVTRDKNGLRLMDAKGNERLRLMETPAGLELKANGKPLARQP